MKVQNGGSGWAYFGVFKYQKTGEMDRKYPFLFFSNSESWDRLVGDETNYF